MNTCDQTITVQDTTRPTITCPTDTLVICFTDVPAVDLNAVLSTDNCTQIVIITHVGDSIGDSTCINGLTVFRTYRATDSCGNFNECIQQITVLDTEAPQFTYFPNDTLVVCASDLPIQTPLASDNCGLVRVSHVEDIVTDSGCINQFTLWHIWEAVDTCQNMIRDTQMVVVRDTILPQFTYFPNDTLVNCMTDLPIQMPQAADNCGLVRVSLVEDIITDSNCINQFTLLHIWEAVDTCQNMVRDTQVVIVRDTLLPAFTFFPNDTTVACAADITIQVPEASDNCGPVRVSLVEENTIDSSCVNQKTRLFIWEAVDTCQNAIRDTQFVFVLDTVGPEIPVPGNIEVVQCGTFFSIVLGIVATDNCDGMVPVDADISIIDSTCPGDYKILIVYTSNDTCGNFSEVRDTIIVIDTLDPVITCPGDYTLGCEGGLPAPITSLDSFFLAGGQIYDSCCLDSSSFRFIQEILDCDADGDPTLSRYYAIDDCCGHSDTCVQVITIPPCLLDLALRKTLNAPEPYFAGYGGTVPFTITVYNQFCVPADSIKIIEYLPSVGSSVTDPGWVNNGDGTACLLLTSNDLLPLGGLLYGDSVVISFTVQLGLDFGDGTGINRAEIFSANTPDGPASDVDSDPNNNPGDDIIVDDVIDNSGSDEDDYDIAQFFVCQPLVCNNHVNVSLEEDCELCFTADDFLEGGALPEEFYTIELFAGGKKLPGNCVDRAYLGYTLTYSVLINSPCGNNSCWGTVTIEDKAPPMIDCRADTVLCFELSNLPSEGMV
ncbi:MAG TPA: hypothetical protein PKM27_15930, partial [Saprospiraceae bacterium]|nr:hypothetical protein [Saprospiraceae bacterium]